MNSTRRGSRDSRERYCNYSYIIVGFSFITIIIIMMCVYIYIYTYYIHTTYYIVIITFYYIHTILCYCYRLSPERIFGIIIVFIIYIYIYIYIYIHTQYTILCYSITLFNYSIQLHDLMLLLCYPSGTLASPIILCYNI